MAVVTGATGALGRVVTRRLLLEGASVVALFRSEEKFNLLKNYVGETVNLSGFKGDATTEEGCRGLVDSALKEHGHVDVMMNIAGGYRGGFTLAETSVGDWDWLMNLNLRSVYLSCRAVIPHMIERDYGRIVNISAKTSSREGRKFKSAAYAVSKAGVRVLTEALAEEVSKYNINVNCVMPSVIDTEANRAAYPKARYGNWVPPSDIAELIVFLSSDASSHIRGACIPIYGKS